MTGTWLDVDAPNTAWRAASEDPIPVWLGRWAKTAFLYRLVTCRELDGHARTNATFMHAGTKARNVSGKVLPYRYWPRWKQGLFISRIPPVLGTWGAVGAAADALNLSDLFHYQTPLWLTWEAPAGLYAPLAGWGLYRGGQKIRNYKFEKHYVAPLRGALITSLRTREGVKLHLNKDLVGAKTPGPTGRVFLPPTFVGSDDERENLVEICRGRLSASALDATFDMQGARPSMTLFVPPQPPALVDWDLMMANWDADRPYLGESASGHVRWNPGESSPHIGVVGGTGDGKSELVAWIVAQFMRGGAGVVVLDPKGTSHRWLKDIPDVLYCGDPGSLTATVLSLAAELKRRADINLNSTRDQDFPRLIVLLEERNTMQEALFRWWKENAPPGRRGERAPAISALAGLGAMGRSVNITLVMVGQETAKAEIGTKSNYGAWAISGGMATNHWRTIMGAGGKKPAMGVGKGSFGYVVGGVATVFQAAYPALDTAKEIRHSARLKEWATSGDPLWNVAALLQQVADDPMPSPGPIAADDVTHEFVTLRDMASERVSLTSLRTWSNRYTDFPAVQQIIGREHYYDRAELAAYISERIGDDDES